MRPKWHDRNIYVSIRRVGNKKDGIGVLMYLHAPLIFIGVVWALISLAQVKGGRSDKWIFRGILKAYLYIKEET